MSDLSQLRLGTAPDSWGVWFPSDPHQVTWDVYLDEIAAVGYVYTELGPQGFMPQDPAQLKEELAKRNLTVCGGTVFAGLHKGKDALDKAIAEFGQEARLLAAVGAEYLVHLPEQYTDQHTGAATESRRPRPRAVEEPRVRHRRAGEGHLRRVRREAGLPPARRHPRRHPGPDRALPVRHRPASW